LWADETMNRTLCFIKKLFLKLSIEKSFCFDGVKLKEDEKERRFYLLER